jgi:hypothetical protein
MSKFRVVVALSAVVLSGMAIASPSGNMPKRPLKADRELPLEALNHGTQDGSNLVANRSLAAGESHE